VALAGCGVPNGQRETSPAVEDTSVRVAVKPVMLPGYLPRLHEVDERTYGETVSAKSTPVVPVR
jgi:hypothetical protein